MKRCVIAILIIATAVMAVACSKEEPEIKNKETVVVVDKTGDSEYMPKAYDTEEEALEAILQEVVGESLEETYGDAVEKVQDRINYILDSEFTDYDGTVVTGTQVKSALSYFEDRDLAILLATKSWLISKGNDGRIMYVGTPTLDKLPVVKVHDIDGDGNNDKAVNYGALLADKELKLNEYNRFTSKKGFINKSGETLYNKDYSDTESNGNSIYIENGVRFNSYVIIDADNKICGLVFVERIEE